MFVRLPSHLKIIITTDHTVIQSFAVCYRAVLVLMRHSYKETHNQFSVSQKWQLYETKWKQLKMTLTASPRRTVFCGILLTAFFAAVVSRFWNSNMYTQETIIQPQVTINEKQCALSPDVNWRQLFLYFPVQKSLLTAKHGHCNGVQL